MSKKDCKKKFDKGQENEIASEFGKKALEGLGELMTEKEIDLQKGAIKIFSKIAKEEGPLTRRDLKTFIKSLESGKINPNCYNELIEVFNATGDVGISELLRIIGITKHSDSIRKFYIDVLTKIDDNLITETLIAEKIIAPGNALALEVILRVADEKFFELKETAYDKKFDYSMELEIIKNNLTPSLQTPDPVEKIRALKLCDRFFVLGNALVPEIVNLVNPKETEEVQVTALQTLGAIGSEDAVKAITKMLNVGTPFEIRMAAISAMGDVKTDSEKAVQILISQTLHDQDEKIRFQTITALGKIGEPAASILVEMLEKEESVQQVEIGLKRIGEPAIPHLLDAMKNKKTKKYAIDIAKMILTPKYGLTGTVTKLLGFLGDKDEDVQEEVKNTIIEMGDPGLESVIRSTSHPDEKIRDNSRDILTRYAVMNIEIFIQNKLKMDTPLHGAEMLALLAVYQFDEDLKLYVIDEFEKLVSNPKYDEHVKRAVIDNVLSEAPTDTDPDIRFGFAQVGYYLGVPAVPYLLPLLDDKDDGVIEVTIDSLGLITEAGSQILPTIAEKTTNKNQDIRLAAVKALGNLGLNEGIPYLIESLGDDNIEIRESAEDAMNQIGEIGLPALIDAMGHKNPKTREYVAKLASSHGEKVWQPLLEKLTIADERFQETAIDMIALLGEDFAAELLTEAQTTMDQNVHIVAIQGFGKLNYEPGLTFIVDSIQAKDKKLNQAIITALESYGEKMVNKMLDELERASGSTEKNLIEFFLKEANPRHCTIPIIQQLGKDSSKSDDLAEIIKKYGDKTIVEVMTGLFENNQIDTAKNLVDILAQHKKLEKIASKAAEIIPR